LSRGKFEAGFQSKGLSTLPQFCWVPFTLSFKQDPSWRLIFKPRSKIGFSTRCGGAEERFT
jgi:hypothetical protein